MLSKSSFDAKKAFAIFGEMFHTSVSIPAFVFTLALHGHLLEAFAVCETAKDSNRFLVEYSIHGAVQHLLEQTASTSDLEMYINLLRSKVVKGERYQSSDLPYKEAFVRLCLGCGDFQSAADIFDDGFLRQEELHPQGLLDLIDNCPANEYVRFASRALDISALFGGAVASLALRTFPGRDGFEKCVEIYNTTVERHGVKFVTTELASAVIVGAAMCGATGYLKGLRSLMIDRHGVVSNRVIATSICVAYIKSRKWIEAGEAVRELESVGQKLSPRDSARLIVATALAACHATDPYQWAKLFVLPSDMYCMRKYRTPESILDSYPISEKDLQISRWENRELYELMEWVETLSHHYKSPRIACAGFDSPTSLDMVEAAVMKVLYPADYSPIKYPWMKMPATWENKPVVIHPPTSRMINLS